VAPHKGGSMNTMPCEHCGGELLEQYDDENRIYYECPSCGHTVYEDMSMDSDEEGLIQRIQQRNETFEGPDGPLVISDLDSDPNDPDESPFTIEDFDA